MVKYLRSVRWVSTASAERDDLGRPSFEVLRPMLDSLLILWDDAPPQARMPRERDYGPDHVLTVLGLAAHAHRMGHAVAQLVDAGFTIETAPMVRSIYEYGLTAQWMAQYGGNALLGVLTEEVRQRAAAAALIENLPSVRDRPGAEEVLHGLRENLGVPGTEAKHGARSFQELCRDLDEESLYLAYRALSGYVHAGPTTAAFYREVGDEPGLQLTPREVEHDTTWLFHTCTGLVWAARAADLLDMQRPRRQPLRRAARTLGIPPELHLSANARKRRDRDQAEARRRQRSRGGAAVPGPG